MAEKERIVGELEKNKNEKYVFSIKEFKGTKYLDVRIYLKNGKLKKWKPTKKAITISTINRLCFLDKIYEALQKL